MRIAFAVGFGIILLKLIFDIYMGRVQKEEKQMYAVIPTFFCGMFFGEDLFVSMQRRRLIV